MAILSILYGNMATLESAHFPGILLKIQLSSAHITKSRNARELGSASYLVSLEKM